MSNSSIIYFYSNNSTIDRNNRINNFVDSFKQSIGKGYHLLTPLNYVNSNNQLLYYEKKILERESIKELGTNRNYPYIKEILKFALKDSTTDYIGLLNNDLILTPNLFNFIETRDYDTILIKRFNITDKINYSDYIKGNFTYLDNDFCGTEGFLIKKNILFNIIDKIDDNILINTCWWDEYLSKLLNKETNCITIRATLHPNHKQVWTRDSIEYYHNKYIYDKYMNIEKKNPFNKSKDPVVFSCLLKGLNPNHIMHKAYYD